MPQPGMGASFGLKTQTPDLFTQPLALAFGQHLGAIDDWLTGDDVIPVGNHQHPADFHGVAFIYLKAFDVDSLARRYFILFATGFNYGVNSITSRKRQLAIISILTIHNQEQIENPVSDKGTVAKVPCSNFTVRET